jgi:hypothetical protein
MAGAGPEPRPDPEPRVPSAGGPPAPERDETPGRTLSEEQRRRIAEVFGDVLPATTSDERDDREDAPGRAGDDRFLADRPPHHDREG